MWLNSTYKCLKTVLQPDYSAVVLILASSYSTALSWYYFWLGLKERTCLMYHAYFMLYSSDYCTQSHWHSTKLRIDGRIIVQFSTLLCIKIIRGTVLYLEKQEVFHPNYNTSKYNRWLLCNGYNEQYGCTSSQKAVQNWNFRNLQMKSIVYASPLLTFHSILESWEIVFL